jgi:ribose-phosphate pyrophosphokinase
MSQTHPTAVIVLAAGQGTRMKSALPKVMHPIGGRSLLHHSVAAAAGTSPDHLIVVVRHERDQLVAHLDSLPVSSQRTLLIADQDEVPGTGRATECALTQLPEDLSGTVVVTYGDVPLLTTETINGLVEIHESNANAVTVLSAEVDDPTGYGRIIRDEAGSLQRIVEQKDANETERAVREINSGIYAFDASALREGLASLTTDNAQGEKYLTDVIGHSREAGRSVAATATDDLWQVEGANDRVQLANLGKELNRRQCEKFMRAGVSIIDPDTTWIDVDVSIAADATILPGTQLLGATDIAPVPSSAPTPPSRTPRWGRTPRSCAPTVNSPWSARAPTSDRSPTCVRAPSSVSPERSAPSWRRRTPISARVRRCPTSPTSAMRRSGRARTSEPPRCSSTTTASTSTAPSSASMHAWARTICMSPLSPWATAPIRVQARRCARMSLQERWPFRWHRSATWRAGSRQTVPARLQRRQPKTHPKGNGSVNEITTAGDKKLVLVSGRANPELAEQVAENLGTELLPTDIYNFANGEIYVRYSESVRGSDVFVLQSHCAPINEWLMEQLIMVDALKRASAKRITVIAPFFPYARQDKKHRGREPISARLVADLYKTAGADRIITVDLHTAQIQGYFDGPVDHLIAMPILAGYVKDKYPGDLAVVSPDAGRIKVAENWSNSLGGVPLAFIHKTRDITRPNETKANRVVGEVEGRTCVLVDDMIDTGGTIVQAADACMAAGAKGVIVVSTHAVFSGPAVERLSNSVAEEVIVTNTLPLSEDKIFDKLTVLSIAPLIARAVHEVFEDGSVTSLFEV